MAAERWLSRLLQLLLLAFLARFLSPAEFGTVALVGSLVMLIASLAEFGLGTYLQVVSEVTRELEATAFWLNLALSVCATLLAGAIAALVIEPSFGRTVFLCCIPALPIVAFASVPTAKLLRQFETRTLALRRVVGDVVGGLVAVVAAANGAGAWSLVAQLITSAIVSTAVVVVLSRWRPRMAFRTQDARSIIRFGSRAWGAQALAQIRDRADELVVASALGATLLGAWTVATRLPRAVNEMFGAMVLSVAPSSFANVVDDESRVQRVYEAAVSYLAMLIFPSMAFLAVASDAVIRLVFGDNWDVAIDPARVAAIAMAVSCVNWLDGALWFALKRPSVELRLTGMALAVHLAALALGTLLATSTALGLLGFAVAYAARVVIIGPVRILALRLRADFSLSVYRHLPAVAACACVAGTGTWFIGSQLPDRAVVETLVGGATFGALYVAGLLLTKRRLIQQLVTLVRPRSAA